LNELLGVSLIIPNEIPDYFWIIDFIERAT